MAVWVDMFLNQQKKINIIEDVDALQNDPARRIEYDCLHPQGIQSLITVPVFVDGNLHGFLGVDNPHAHMNAPELLTQVTYIAANELQKRLLTEELTNKSYHDPLTGLRNRLAYDEVLEQLLGKGVVYRRRFSRPQRLKVGQRPPRMRYGQQSNSQSLCYSARAYRPAVYLPNQRRRVCYHLAGCTVQGVHGCGRKAGKTLYPRKKILRRSAMSGIATRMSAPPCEKAEKAMQTAKNKFYATNTELQGHRPGYLDALLQEFRDSTFIAYLQPLYSIQYGCVYGAEVLVRKIDPHGNIHTPVEFIGIMEREHMISMVDFAMLRQSCELIQKWKSVWPHLVLNVNFSRHTLMEPDYLERVDRILAETDVDPAQLVFEITESSQNIQLESLSSLLDEVKKRGITLALDDLGTEAACLEMLYLPQIDVVKIDKNLIDKSGAQRPHKRTVIRSLVSMCHDLKMRCVAEGIETQSQVELLKQL